MLSNLSMVTGIWLWPFMFFLLCPRASSFGVIAHKRGWHYPRWECPVEPEFSTLARGHLGQVIFFAAGVCPMNCRMFSSVLGLSQLDVNSTYSPQSVTIKNVSKYCQMFLGSGEEAKFPPVKNHCQSNIMWTTHVILNFLVATPPFFEKVKNKNR